MSDEESDLPPARLQELENDLQPLHKLDRLIHEPARLLILAALNKVEEADFKFLSVVTGLTKGNLLCPGRQELGLLSVLPVESTQSVKTSCLDEDGL